MDHTDPDLPESLHRLELAPLFRIRFEVDTPEDLGPSPFGRHRLSVIRGGRFDGDRLRGHVHDGGNDRQQQDADGNITTDVRTILETDDSARIGLDYRGVRAGDPDVLARLDAGEDIDPADYYFRLTATFRTGHPGYRWLNYVLAAGTGHRYPDGPIYNIFQIT